jgi:hypothetical protein
LRQCQRAGKRQKAKGKRQKAKCLFRGFHFGLT